MPTRISSLWKRFLKLAPKPTEFLTVIMEEIVLADGSKGTRPSNTHKPRVWRWLNAKESANKCLFKVLNKEESFCFQPYSYTPPGIMKPTLFKDANEELVLVPREACSRRALKLLVIMALTLPPCKLKSERKPTGVWPRKGLNEWWYLLLQRVSDRELIHHRGRMEIIPGDERIFSRGWTTRE